ncbi:MAG: hypothetical protein JNJ47_02110 [Alphaproteobacteria bacterium]|nr:hypothetical protein [Alphaproteobacteria bacterium]
MFSKLNPRRKSEEHPPPPLSPTASPALLKELQELQTIRAQEQQVTTQEKKEEFPPKRLSPKQVQSIMKASFPLVLAKLSNELKETDPHEKNDTFVELNNEIRASIHQTSLARFTGLLVATQADYINSLQKSQQKAREAAFISLNQIHTDKDSSDCLKTYKDCTIDNRIVVIRLEPITVVGSNVLYSYQFMVGGQNLSIPYLDGGELTLLDGKVNFNFIKQSSE